jgi:hypothetical protein
LEAKQAKPRTIIEYNQFFLKLKECLGPNKRYPRGVKPVTIKKQEPLPDYLIGNIPEYFDSIKKGSNKFRKIISKSNNFKSMVDIGHWQTKLDTDIVSARQIKNCFKGLVSKFIPNDCLDYKARAIHGKTQWNSNLVHTGRSLNKWCSRCLERGWEYKEDFKHAVYECPSIQFLLWDIVQHFNIGNRFNPTISNVVLSSTPPLNASKVEVTQHQVYDMIMVVAIKEILQARASKDDLVSHKVITNITHCLRTTVRCYPHKDISAAITSLQLAI